MIKHRIRNFFPRLFTWKGFFTTFGIIVALLFLGVFVYLWYISNYPNIPAYQEISAYRYLTPSSENVCDNPEPTNDDANDPGNDLKIPSYQGWCNDMRQHYYRVPQGTDFFGLRYDWITALEKPVGKKPLVSREYMQRLGYIYDPLKKRNKDNPNDLPIGLTWHYDKESDAKILDVSCAACHSAQITYRGTALVIDGGPGGHALPSLQPAQFLANTIVSLLTTYLNPLKFGRFSRKVLMTVPESEYRAEKKKLRAATWKTIKEALRYGRYNLFLYPTEEGYGRTDGLGRIANTVYGDYITPDNYRIADAPVNYPHVWDIWAFDWVQWMGSVRQAMARNVNEAMGTRARINLTHADGLYDNSVMMSEVHCVETTLQHLQPPRWPEDLFGEIDPVLRDEGKIIFEDVCEKCHGPFPRKAIDGVIPYDTAKYHQCTTCHGPLMTDKNGDLLDLIDPRNSHPEVELDGGVRLGNWSDEYADQEKRGDYWDMIHIPLNYIGTDPTSAMNMINNKFDISSVFELIGQQEPGSVLEPPDYIEDPKNADFASGLRFIGGEVRYKQYREWGIMEGYKPVDENAVNDLNGFGESDLPVGWRAYRPRPLEGVWATAPFLHNGSVPSIYELLLPAEERSQVFYLGRKEYDPDALGIVVNEFKGAFEFDTSITGNSNLGHEFDDGLCGDGVIGYAVEDRPGYCRQFTERERMAILEYMKVHSDGERPNSGSLPHCKNMTWPEKP